MMYRPIQIFYCEYRSVNRPWCSGQFKFSTVSTGASIDHDVPANSNFLLWVQERQETMMYRPIQIFYCEYRSVNRPWCTGQFKFSTVSTRASRYHFVPANSYFLLWVQERHETIMYRPIQIFYCEYKGVKRPSCTGQLKFSTVSTGASRDHHVPVNSYFLLWVQERQKTIMYRPIQIFYCE